MAFGDFSTSFADMPTLSRFSGSQFSTLLVADVIAPDASRQSTQAVSVAPAPDSASPVLAQDQGSPAAASDPTLVTITTGAFPVSTSLGALGTLGYLVNSDPNNGGHASLGNTATSLGYLDLNGDGRSELIFGAFGDDTGGTARGSIYFVTGTAANPGTVNLASVPKISGVTNGGQLGSSVSGIGDINGDDRADYAVVAAPSNNNPSTIYVVYGTGSVPSGSSLVTASSSFTITGGAPRIVSEAGDFNNDGRPDLLVADSSVNKVYVIFGHAAGVPFTNINLASLGTAGITISGETGGLLGSAIDSVGDFNGDGIADIILGSSGLNNNVGAAYVVFGRAGTSNISLASLGTGGVKLVGSGTGQGGYSFRAGNIVSGIGDFNGDGLKDVLVGRYPGFGEDGSAYVVFGRASTAQVTITAQAAGTGFTVVGSGAALAGSNIGYSGTGVGDVNGDGFADIAIGAPRASIGGLTSNGAVYVIYGKSGFSATSFDVAALTTTTGFRLTGAANYDYAGLAVYRAGDVNGDTGPDFVVLGKTNVKEYVIYGQAPVNAAPTATNLSAAETYTEDTTLNLTDIVVSDPDSASITATLTLSSAAAGALTTSGGGSYTAGTGVWSVTGTVAAVNTALAAVTFVPSANYNLNFTITTSVSDGVAAAITGSKAFTAVPVDDLPVAVADTATVAENATVSIAVISNDTDVDTGVGATGGGAGPKAVATVNGATLTSGQTTTLASGAIVTLNANGTLGYNPNGKFDYLPSAAVAASTGASNSATDTFGYTLNGGSATTVTVTVTGVVSSGSTDRLPGSSGNDTIVGPNTSSYFDLSQGGNDTATGGSANDAFFFGAAFTGADRVDGGAGTNDQIGLQGNYTGGNALVLQAATITNLETIAVLAGFDYNITTVDANVAAGQTLIIYGASLGVGDDLTFNGSAETAGMFKVYGGYGTDIITTGGGDDGIYFGAGRFNTATDRVDGGAGTNDQMALDGSYTVTIARTNVVNVEVLALLDGQAAPATYNITLADDWTQGAEVHTVYAVGTRTAVTVNGSAETSSMLKFYGGQGADTLTGGSAGNWFDGGAGGDTLTGGAGIDTYFYGTAANSTSVNYDKIVNFNASQDQIDIPGAISAIETAKTGALSTASFDAELVNQTGEITTTGAFI